MSFLTARCTFSQGLGCIGPVFQSGTREGKFELAQEWSPESVSIAPFNPMLPLYAQEGIAFDSKVP